MPNHRPWGAVLLVTAVALLAASWGSAFSVAAQPADEPECPRGVVCRFVPADYAQINPADPNAYGNYNRAERPDAVTISATLSSTILRKATTPRSRDLGMLIMAPRRTM
jgi:hypothetical protein